MSSDRTSRDDASPRAYRTVRRLARGGMGQVDIVVRREGQFRRVYALKRLHSVYADDADVRAMFVDEARIAGLIRHSNVVAVLDAGEDEEGPFLVMDYVEGISVSHLMRSMNERGESVPIPIAVEIARQVALGLHAAHEARGPNGVPLDVVHRDVSPQNILIGFDGTARVTDFGVARALDRVTQTAMGALKGKAGYMSPEQLRYEDLDRRSDLFSLGVVLHELVSGERLYAGDRPVTFRRILEEPPPPLRSVRPETPPSLEAIVLRLLAKTPGKRFASARELAELLEGELGALRNQGAAIDLARFLELHFAADHEEQRGWIGEALASGEHASVRTEPDLAAVPTRRRASLWLLVPAAGVLALGAMALVAAFFVGPSEPEAEPAPTAAVQVREEITVVAPETEQPAVVEPPVQALPPAPVEPPAEQLEEAPAPRRVTARPAPAVEPVVAPARPLTKRPRMGEVVGAEYFPR